MSQTFRNGKKWWRKKLVDVLQDSVSGESSGYKTPQDPTRLHKTPRFWGHEVQWSAHRWRDGCESKNQGHRDTSVGQFLLPQLTRRRRGEPRASWRARQELISLSALPATADQNILGHQSQCNDLSPQRSPYWPYLIGRPETDGWVSRAQMSAVQRNILVLESCSGPGSDSGQTIQSGRSLETP